MSSKAKTLLDDTAVSTRAVYQPRSAKRNHIWHGRISTAISRAKTHLAQQAMMSVYPHSGITNQPSGNTTGTVVYQQQTAKRKLFWTAQPCRPERYVNRDQQIERVSGTAVYQQRSAKQTPPQAQPRPRLRAKIQLAQPCINNEQQSESTSGRHIRIDQSGVSTAISKAQAYLHERYINRDHQSASISGTAVCQQRSAERKHIWHSKANDGCMSLRRHNQSAKRKYN